MTSTRRPATCGTDAAHALSPGDNLPCALRCLVVDDSLKGIGVARDELAFRDFVAGATGRLLRTAYLLVGDAAAAEDLLQDVFERMYGKWARIDDPDAYARRALANSARNRWRSVGRRRETPLHEGHDRAAVEPGDTAPDVLAALATLPSGQRAVVVLRYFDDLSVEQTARALGCSVGTVKSQTARALPRLRTLLGDLSEEHCR